MLCLGAAPISPDIAYRKDVSEVRVTFYATDQQNRTVETLQKNDLAVVDSERVIREFRSFSKSGISRLDVVVLIDSSQSVLVHFRQEIDAVLELIGRTQWIADDSITVVAFSGMEEHILCSGDCRKSLADGRLLKLSSSGATPLYDAVQFSAEFLRNRADPEVRPVVILFSDGEDTNSRTLFADSLQAMLTTDAQIYAVDVGDPKRPQNGSAVLRTMADATGGRYLHVHDGAPQLLSAIVDDLHSAYLLTYALPRHDAGFHTVRILPTRNLNLRFRCRRGYFFDR